ncbi:tellurite resistance protein TelA [Secundilactobacillus silagincola]|uniref:Tellurite resistance protein TelA n=1 Tax=Secundilactobacillus silagincola TaxID=1714681 RepID=A0A1Z5J506_9LACO|nr:toxic anion resistance protein [Secundilactobacillus silagincola]GAX08969.1 tellurite resistance protein TelA [Secundilactobacillus silagincola]
MKDVTSIDKSVVPVSQTNETTPVALATSIKEKLSPEELTEAANMAATISEDKQSSILDYGKTQQEGLSSFSNTVLVKVQNNELGEIGDSLRKLVTSLNETNPDKLSQSDASLFAKLFSKVKASIFEMTAKYQEVSVQIDRSAQQLSKQEAKLLQDNDLLDDMYQQNLKFYQSLNLLIVGASMKHDEINKQIQQLQSTATDQMAAQQVQDLAATQDRLEKRMMDLMLTREITIQQAPQIRLIQNSNTVLAEKIQSSITTAIPLWKNQVVIALALLNQKDALAAQNAVAETTNDLLKKNSKLLSQSAVEVAKASQRGVVDIDTLKQTQDDLINTITETLKIQQEGSVKRKEVESQLQTMESDLKTKLVETVKQQPKAE